MKLISRLNMTNMLLCQDMKLNLEGKITWMPEFDDFFELEW